MVFKFNFKGPHWINYEEFKVDFENGGASSTQTSNKPKFTLKTFYYHKVIVMEEIN